MRLLELLNEAVSNPDIENALKAIGFDDLKQKGNKLTVLVEIPAGAKKNAYRVDALKKILASLQKKFPARYSNDATLSSLGGIIFDDSPLQIVIKDKGKQGDKSAGVANEVELATLLTDVISEYGTANVTFIDSRGVKLNLDDVNKVHVAGRDTANRKKADVVLYSESGELPISIKKVDADMWESADSMFGARAREILDKLVKDGIVTLNKIKERGGIPVYALSKEIVMEPTEEEAMKAIFGSDINPKGGVVIQTFDKSHFKQDKNNITVDSHYVITSKADIPESHLMVWLLRNDSDRNSKSMGIAGIRPLGVTLTRGIGRTGTKDVVLVDVNGNVIKK